MFQKQEKIEKTTSNTKESSKTSKVSATSQGSKLQREECSLQRLRMNEEKSLHHAKGLPMSLVNSTKNFMTTMSKTIMEMKATLTCTLATLKK